MSPTPRVSVVIPAFNAETFVAEAIESALSQTLPPAEIIVVDDGSTDGTLAAADDFDRTVHVLRQNRGGVASARNLGIRHASGDLVAFLDADDFWHPEKLAAQCKLLADRLELGLIGTAVFDWPSGKVPPLSTTAAAPQDIAWNDLIVRNYFTNSSIVVRRALLDKVGLFDTALQGPEDYDLWLRCAAQSKTAILPLPLTGYRCSPYGLGSQPLAMSEGLSHIRNRWVSSGRIRRGGLLHRKAKSHADSACAYLYFKRRRYSEAFRLAVQSLVTYPLPFRKRELPRPAARVVLAAAIVKSWFKSLLFDQATAISE